MCLIAHRPIRGKRGSNIPNGVIEHNLNSNPDGFGIAWRDPQRGLVYEKFAPDAWAAFRALLKEVDADTKVEYVAHWRLATHGAKCLDNSHPFVYEDAVAGPVLVFHNGIIDIATEGSKSDTATFVDKILRKLPPLWWRDEGIRQTIEWAVGGSRLTLMTDEETVHLNRRDWEEEGGLLYSTSPHGWYRVSTKTSWPAHKEEDEEDLLVLAATNVPRSVEERRDWVRGGHDVVPISFLADNGALAPGDGSGDAACDTCFTSGQFWIVDGQLYTDIPHAQPMLLSSH